MTLIAEAATAPEHLGTVRPPANFPDIPRPSAWRQMHAETLAMGAHAPELMRRYGEEAVHAAMATASNRQKWLDVQGYRRATQNIPATVHSALIAAQVIDPDTTGVVVVPESAYESNLPGHKKSTVREAAGEVLPSGITSEAELQDQPPMPPDFKGEQRAVVAGALMIEAAQKDDYAGASAAEVLFTAYGDVLGATADTVGVHVEQPVPPTVQ